MPYVDVSICDIKFVIICVSRCNMSFGTYRVKKYNFGLFLLIRGNIFHILERYVLKLSRHVALNNEASVQLRNREFAKSPNRLSRISVSEIESCPLQIMCSKVLCTLGSLKSTACRYLWLVNIFCPFRIFRVFLNGSLSFTPALFINF